MTAELPIEAVEAAEQAVQSLRIYGSGRPRSVDEITGAALAGAYPYIAAAVRAATAEQAVQFLRDRAEDRRDDWDLGEALIFEIAADDLAKQFAAADAATGEDGDR